MAAERSRSRSRSPGSKRIALKEAKDSLVEAWKNWNEAHVSLFEAERAADDVATVEYLNQKALAKAGSIPDSKPPIIMSSEKSKLYRRRFLQEAQDHLLEVRAALRTADNRLSMIEHERVRRSLSFSTPENVADMDGVGA